MRRTTQIVVAVTAVALALAVAPSPARPISHCPVTIPTREVQPNAGFGPAGFNYGGRWIRAHLSWPGGVLPAGELQGGGSYATVSSDGSIYTKVGWWRGLAGKLTIAGRRLDRKAPPLQASVPGGYGATGFVPSGLTFPTVGCWRVVGSLGQARLIFVVRVRAVSR